MPGIRNVSQDCFDVIYFFCKGHSKPMTKSSNLKEHRYKWKQWALCSPGSKLLHSNLTKFTPIMEMLSVLPYESVAAAQTVALKMNSLWINFLQLAQLVFLWFCRYVGSFEMGFTQLVHVSIKAFALSQSLNSYFHLAVSCFLLHLILPKVFWMPILPCWSHLPHIIACSNKMWQQRH